MFVPIIQLSLKVFMLTETNICSV